MDLRGDLVLGMPCAASMPTSKPGRPRDRLCNNVLSHTENFKAMFPALAATVLMLFAMGYFLLGTLPLLIRLKYDTAADARFMRGLFNVYFIALACAAALAALSYAFISELAFTVGAGCIAALALVLRALMLKRMDALRATMQPGDPAAVRKFRRLHIAGLLANGVQLAAVGFGLTRLSTEGDPRSLPIPKRVLTGRDASGKSVFRSRTVSPQVVEIESNPGLAFYELYSTDGVPQLTGQEPDPMLKKTRDFLDPGGTFF